MKKIFWLILLLTGYSIFYTGCTKNSEINQARIYETKNVETKNNKIEVYDSYTNQFAQELIRNDNINKAIIVTTATDILIGVRLDNETNINNINDIKNEIKDEVIKKFGNNKEITIITTNDLFVRMEKLADDIKRQKPITGFFEELGAIIRNVIPVV